MRSSTSQEKCEKLSDPQRSSSLLISYSNNNVSETSSKSKSGENVMPECAASNKTFKCLYCCEYYPSDEERVKHIEYEHPGKMYCPTPEDFRNRRLINEYFTSLQSIDSWRYYYSKRLKVLKISRDPESDSAINRVQKSYDFATSSTF
jgi:hypothetical protein